MQNGDIPNTTAIDYKNIAEKWSAITIDRMRKSMAKQKIHKGDLYNSLTFSSSTASGIMKIQLYYKLYGMFVDMGVGRGVPIGARGTKNFQKFRNKNGQLLTYRRKAKPWYSKVILAELNNLAGIMSKEYIKEGILTMQLPRLIEIKL